MPLGPEKIQEKDNCGKILGAGGDLSFGLLEGCRCLEEPVSGVLVCLAAQQPLTSALTQPTCLHLSTLCLFIPNSQPD